jgi:hypothetical protein
MTIRHTPELIEHWLESRVLWHEVERAIMTREFTR